MNKQTKHFYQFGSFRINPSERLLSRDGEEVRLTPKVFEVLLYLVENPGRVLDKDELMKEIWSETFVEEVNLAKNISVLRKVLDEEGNPEIQYIETIPKRGYRFTADVEQIWDETEVKPLAEKNRNMNVAAEENAENGEIKVGEESKKNTALTQPENLDSRFFKGNRFIRLFGFFAFALLAVAAVWFVVSHSMNNGSPSASQKIIPFTTFPGSESSPAISPDGKQIAFTWGGESGENTDIYVKLVGAGEPLRLTSEPVVERTPVWSPDGSQIAFLRESASGNGIYVIPSLGGAARKLADTYGLPFSWSPSGEFLAVAEKSSREEPFSLFLLSTKTGEKRKLTNPPAQYFGDRDPVFSPDGKTLAFARMSAVDVEDIYLLPVAGGEPQRLTFDDKFLGGLDWTADGHEIVFSSTRSGDSNLWRIPVSGGAAPQPLPGVGTGASSPSVSRQGNRLAYMQSMSDSNIWRTEVSNHKARASSPTRLISSTLPDYSPDFSPDGKKIVFGSIRSGNSEIWLAEGDGSNPLQLTSIGGGTTGSPRFSPDSRHIVFDSRPEGNADIFIINTEERSPRRLTTENSEDILPSWSRDGQWIYYCSNRSGEPQIWKMSPDGERATQVTKQGGYEAVESPDGKYIYYTKGRNTPGIWKIPADGGEEILVLDYLRAGFLRYWTVTGDGIYFGTRSTASPTIQFFDFASGQLSEVIKLDKSLLVGNSGLAVSPDERWLLYAQIDQSGSDIMVINNFY